MTGAKPAAATGGKQDLEEALLQIVHQHRQRQQTEKAKKDAMKSAVRVAELLVDKVDGGVQELYVNEKCIELEARALLGTIAWYRRQTDQWLVATNEINSVLKEADAVGGSAGAGGGDGRKQHHGGVLLRVPGGAVPVPRRRPPPRVVQMGQREDHRAHHHRTHS